MEFKPDAISITETWIKPSSPGPNKDLKGYYFVSNWRENCNGRERHFMLKTVYLFVCDGLTIINEKKF